MSSNSFYPPCVDEYCREVSDLASDVEIQRLVHWIITTLMPLPEATRRAISRFGSVGGCDYGNISYTIFWHMALEWGPADDPAFAAARKWGCPNTLGNLIEGALACLDFAHAGLLRLTHPHDRARLSQTDWNLAAALIGGLATANCFVIAAPKGVLQKLKRGIHLVWELVYTAPTTSVFEGLRRASGAYELREAAAHIEAFRMGWPSMSYAIPGYRPSAGDWVCYSIRWFPERLAALLAELESKKRRED